MKNTQSMRASVAIRTEKIDIIPTTPAHAISTYLFCEGLDSRGDVIYVGCDDGRISESWVGGRSQRVDDVSVEGTQHSTVVTCLMYTRNKGLCPHTDGYLFSGSGDRTIKVWNPTSFIESKIFVSTCYGHDGPISMIVDGCDGSFLSSSMDGTLKRWTAQKDRSLLLHPFFECTFNLTMKDSWITALAVNPRGCWSCYFGDSNGNIDVYRKDQSTRDKELYTVQPANQLTKHTCWEKFHSLGITLLQLSFYENYLFSLSFDCTCKITDCNIGCVFFTVENPKFAMYTGAIWMSDQLNLYLVDELGSLSVFNTFQEKIIATSKVKAPKSEAHRNTILSCHKGPLMCNIQKFRNDAAHSDQYLLLFPATNRIHGVGSNAVKQFSGEVSTWRVQLDNRAMEFVGNDDIVVGISVLDFYGGSGLPVVTMDTASAYLTDAMSESSGGSSTYELESTASAESSSARSVGSGSMLSRGSKPAVSASVDSLPGLRKKRRLPLPARAVVEGLKASHSLDLRKHKLSSLISREEAVFFSVSSDATIRCWWEVDGRENYRFKDKSNSEITSVKVIWSLNCIATGHENGLVSLWHGDSGSKVESRALQMSVTSLIEARNAHSQLLVGSDLSGKIAIWNLTLYMIYPSQLSMDRIFQGFHDKEDPGICSLSFHWPTRTMFSAGDDRTIRSWKMQNETAHCTRTWHRDVICSLECTESFLLSGDESGEIVLWRLLWEGDTPASANTHTYLSMLTKWNQVRSAVLTRAVCTLYEVDRKNLMVLQAGRLPDRTQLWHVEISPAAESKSESVAVSASPSAAAGPPPPMTTARRKSKLSKYRDLIRRAAITVDKDPSIAFTVGSSKPGSSLPPLLLTPESEDVKLINPYYIFDDAHPDFEIVVKPGSVFIHENREISCAIVNLVDLIRPAPPTPPKKEPSDGAPVFAAVLGIQNIALNADAAVVDPANPAAALALAGVGGSRSDVPMTGRSVRSGRLSVLGDVAAAGGTSTPKSARSVQDMGSLGTKAGLAASVGAPIVPPLTLGVGTGLGPGVTPVLQRATSASYMETEAVDPEELERRRVKRIARLAVYLGTVQGPMMRYEVEVPISREAKPAVTEAATADF